MNAISEEKPLIGTVRETFFVSQLRTFHKVKLSKQADYLIDDKYTIEIGGKSKEQKQIEGIENAWIVKDDIELPLLNTIPLWLIGLLY